jgi:hypothetical protein
MLTDELITEALLSSGGIFSDAARHLSERLGRPITRPMVEQRVHGSRLLLAVRQIAEQRAVERIVSAGRETRRQRRSAAMKESWDRRKGQIDVADNPEHMDVLTRPNVRARTRASSAITAATVQAERDKRLCCARTRKGLPCVRRVVPGKNRCPSHGGKSTGPRTAEGKARIAAAQRARWERYRQERYP